MRTREETLDAGHEHRTPDADARERQLQERARALFTEHLSRVHRRTDRMFAFLMGLQWLAAALFAAWFAPEAVRESAARLPQHIGAAVILGGLAAGFPVLLAFWRPGTHLTRQVIAVAQMLMVSLIIHLLGTPEAHFHVFGSLAFLAFYLDWRVLATASLVIGADHLLGGLFQFAFPAGAFGADPAGASGGWRWLIHAGWIAFLDVSLLLSCRYRQDEMRAAAERQARLEATNVLIEESAEAVRASEERFRSLSTSSPIGIFRTDAGGNFVYGNERWRAITGLGEDEAPGAGWKRVFAPECRDALTQDWEAAARTGDEISRECRLAAAGPHERWVLLRASAVRSSRTAGTTGFVGTLEDITERKAYQARLEEAYQKEHRIAASLQRSLLLAPREDAFGGLLVRPFYQAALREANVGGDFFDAFALANGQVALVVGDVSGKGLAAAARTAELKYVLRAYLRESPDPAGALARTNHFVCDAQALDEHGFGTFIALALAVVHPASGACTFALAGAEPPLLLLRNGGSGVVRVAAVEEQGGLPLGLEAHAVYQPIERTLGLGDLILLATDGLTEARRGRELLGPDRAADLARDAAEQSATLDALGEKILEGARTFAGGPLQDDVCLLLARRVETPDG